MFDLYLITPERSASEIVERTARALQAEPTGRVAFQLRANHLSTRSLFEVALELRELTRRVSVPLFVNDRVDVALACGADGVQLPEKGLPISAARASSDGRLQIGVSCHDSIGLERAADGGADFATLAPVFEVPGKNPALGIHGFGALAAGARLPVIALGGIGLRHLPELYAAGASGIAVIREVFDAPDPGAALRACLAAARALRRPTRKD